MLFVREDISRKLLSAENYPMDSFYIEDNYEKLNGCFYKCSYNPIRCKNYFYLENLNEGSTLYSSHFENFNIIGNFDVKAKIELFQFLVILMTCKALLRSQIFLH